MISEEKLTQLKELLEKIPPAPWFVVKQKTCYSVRDNQRSLLTTNRLLEPGIAEFIILARNTLPELIEQIESLKQQLTIQIGLKEHYIEKCSKVAIELIEAKTDLTNTEN